jgi:NOL1/NOP2/fmu family ribosome biogenesis protein
VALESDEKRIGRIGANTARLGITVVRPVLGDALAYRENGYDRVLVDAPCSGEGMFRKSEAARQDWSPDLVRSCALRQSTILEAGARLTRPGGLLGYSTCTFNPQENEQTLAGFLRRRPDFELVHQDMAPGMRPGRPEWAGGADPPPLERAARLWPHLAPGEGHFVAVMRRNMSQAIPGDQLKPPKFLRGAGKRNLPLEEVRTALAGFCQAHLRSPPQSVIPQERLARLGDQLYLIPPQAPDLGNLRILRPGWWLGEIHTAKTRREARFEPSHALALGLKAEDARQVLDLEATSPQTLAYLRGEVLDWAGEDGWVLVCVDGYPLGWGRGVQGKLKNHYPRGLRWV